MQPAPRRSSGSSPARRIAVAHNRAHTPAGWPPPRGYSNGVAARGRQVFVAGMVGWDEQGRFPSDDFAAQARQALENIVTVLAQAGAKPEHIVRMTWYVTSKREYLDSGKALGAAYREVIGRHFPVMTAVEVSALMEDRAKVEIEVTAVVPD
jgi:enamine deaminase RidA (YjgF/YER057c/UK114 family)